MSDITLFQLKNSKAQKIKPEPLTLEKKIQKICEQNLPEFFGITCLSTEYSTGKNHGGRIDTLGIDENSSPVIIEYKLSSSENVINQGLYYLDWLMDHKADFEMLCLELASSTSLETKNVDSHKKISTMKGIQELIESAPKNLLDLYEEIDEYILSLGDDIQKKELKHYHAYSRIRNFVCVEVHPTAQKIALYLKVPFHEIEIKDPRIRDVSQIGHFGTGDTEVVIKKPEDIELLKTLIKKSYELS